MHLVFAVHAGKASLASACRRLMKAAEDEGFSCSLLGEKALSPAEDAVILDSSDMTMDAVVAAIVDMARERAGLNR